MSVDKLLIRSSANEGIAIGSDKPLGVQFWYRLYIPMILASCIVFVIYLNLIVCSTAKSKVTKKDLTAPREVPELNMETCQGLNIYNTGEDPQILEESHYPTWLWSLLDSSDNLTPDDKRYWSRLRKAKLRANNNLLKRR